MRVTGFALALTSFAVLTACSGSPAPVTPEPSSVAPTGPPQSSTDQAIADKSLPAIADLGAGYTSHPYDPESSAEEDARLNTCLGLPPTKEHETAKAYSPLFTMGDAQQIQFGVTFADAVDRANADLAVYAGPRAQSCIHDSFQRQFDAAGRSGQITISRVTPSPGGEDAVTYRIIAVSGGVPTVIDIVSAISGRAELSATFLDVNDPVAVTMEDRLVHQTLARLAGNP